MTAAHLHRSHRAGLLALGLALFLMPAAPALATGRSFHSDAYLAPARGPYSVEILVDGRPLPEYLARGTTYVEALRGREYSIRLRNHTPQRVAVALSVDGLSTIDAKATPASLASKWILGPYGSLTLDGWQTSSDTARRFFFTSEDRSYGAWLGKTRDLGLISAAFFRERRFVPAPIIMREEGGAGRGDEMRGSAEEPRAAGERRDGPRGSAAGAPAEGLEGGRDADTGAPSAEGRSKSAPRTLEAQPQLSDDYAATGIGREVDHSVRHIHFVTERSPAAVVQVRYEYAEALARLGVLPEPCERYEDALARRERAHGFDGMEFAPDPFARDRFVQDCR